MGGIGRFRTEECGAAAAEYALILAIVTAGIVIAITLLGGTIANAMNNAASYLLLAHLFLPRSASPSRPAFGAVAGSSRPPVTSAR